MTRVTQIKTNRITKMNKMISLVITILIFKIIFHQMILPIKFRGMIKIKQQLQINILKTQKMINNNKQKKNKKDQL